MSVDEPQCHVSGHVVLGPDSDGSVSSTRLVCPALDLSVLARAPHVPVQRLRSHGVQAFDVQLREQSGTGRY